jgi:ribosome-binding protein aMBF1 (putative translation factor)
VDVDCAVVAVAVVAAEQNDVRLTSYEPDLTEPLARFAENLRRARERAGMSQEAVAFVSGMHRTALSRLECRERAPEFRTLVRLSRALGVTPGSLLRGVE